MPRRLASRIPGRRAPAPGLRAELAGDVPWDYPWRLGPGRSATPAPGYMAGSAEALLASIESVASAAFSRGRERRALVVGCGDGWLCHRLLELGAEQVTGIDEDGLKVRRARMVALHLGVGNIHLSFEQGRLADMRLATMGRFDVVVLADVIGRVSDPLAAMRRARELCGDLCLVDTELARLDPSAAATRLGDDHDRGFTAAWATLADADGVAFIPSAPALREVATVTGFSDFEPVAPATPALAAYIEGQRGTFALRV